MINPQLATYGTTLAQAPVNPLSAQSLVQQPGVAGGIPQIPTGEVETKYGPTTEHKVPGADTISATGAMDTAQQAKLDAMDQQAKRDVAVEQAQAQAAEQRAKEAAEIEKKREEMRAAEERRRAEETAARAQALAEYEKASKTSTLWQDMTPARKFISAIATGLGQWSSVMGGGPNGAYQIFRDAEENHRHLQETNIRKATEKVMQQTKSAEEAKKYFDTAMDNLDKQQLAKLKLIDLQLAAVEKASPEAAARAAQARAQVQIDYEKGKRDFVSGYDTTVRQQGTSTQTSSGNKNPTDPAIHETADQRTMALYAANMRREIDKMKSLPPISEEGLRKFQDNETQMYAAAEEAKSLGGAAKVVALRRLDALTRSKFEGVSEDDAVAINGMESANEAFRRVLSGANIQEKEKADLLSQNQIQPGDSPKLRASKLQRMDEITEDFMTLSGNAGKRLTEATVARSTGKVGSPNRVRGIPAEKQDAAIGTADNYGAIREAVSTGKVKLSPSEQSDIKDVLQALKKDPTDADAARFLIQLRQRKGI